MDYKFNARFNQNRIVYDDIELVENDFKLNRFLFDFDIEDGAKIFEMRTPSGKTWVKEIVDNILVLADENDNHETISVLPENGEYTFEISLIKNGGKVTVHDIGRFYVRNEVVTDDDEAISTDKNYPVLVQLISEVQEAISDCETATGNAETATENANETTSNMNDLIDLVNQKLENGDFKGDKGDKGDIGDCNFATFDIDFTTGELIMYKTDDLFVDFNLNEETGELFVVIPSMEGGN